MAPSAQVAAVLPKTLPEDFGEWDSANAPKTGPSGAGGIQVVSGFGAAPKPPSQSAERRLAITSDREGFRSQPSPSGRKSYASEYAFLDELISAGAGVDRSVAAPSSKYGSAVASRAVAKASTASRPLNLDQVTGSSAVDELRTAFDYQVAVSEADEVLQPAIQSKKTVPVKRRLVEEEPAREARPRRTWRIVVVSLAAALLLAVTAVLLFRPSWVSMAMELVRPQRAAVEPLSTAPELKPFSSEPYASQEPAATDPTQPASTDKQSGAQSAVGADESPTDGMERSASQVQSQMMNDQLRTPARISAEMKSKPVEEAPPAAAPAGMEGLSGSGTSGNVLSGQARSGVKVMPPKVINVSEGVAAGLLVVKTAPVYPKLPKKARVYGTVVLTVTVSKTGAVENLNVVSGPEVLWQAALDAVRTWRFKPYLFDNQPTEIATNLSVNFNPKK